MIGMTVGMVRRVESLRGRILGVCASRGREAGAVLSRVEASRGCFKAC